MAQARMIPLAAGRIAAALGAGLAALGLLAGVALAQVATGTADSFRSNGDLIADWYWLRDSGLGHYAEYTWADPPATGDITLEFNVLATDRVSGGPGVNAHFGLLAGFPGAGNMGGVFHHVGVSLQNVSPSNDPVGYTNHGFITLRRAKLDQVMAADEALFIRVLREGANLPHVAFRGDSIKIVAGGGGRSGGEIVTERGGGAGDIGISRGGSQIVIDGTVTLPDEAVDLQTEFGDWGDEGNCFLDRPCLGDDADGFRSSGFAGAEGWYWLRAPTVGQTAEYLFETPPLGRALVLDIAVLGQNLAGAVPKDTLHVNLTLGYPGSGSLGGQIGPVAVAVPRLWIGPDEDVWRGRALVVIPPAMAEAVIPAVGGLFVTFERIDAYEPDVGFSAGSVLLYPAQDVSR
jgi:hypothetical protein